MTEQFSESNPGFENDPACLAEREAHRALAGRLIAVHKLRTTARSLETILGAEEFKRLQRMGAQGGKRYRWSVAFPIVESYEIVGRPKAKGVLKLRDRYAPLRDLCFSRDSGLRLRHRSNASCQRHREWATWAAFAPPLRTKLRIAGKPRFLRVDLKAPLFDPQRPPARDFW